MPQFCLHHRILFLLWIVLGTVGGATLFAQTNGPHRPRVVVTAPSQQYLYYNCGNHIRLYSLENEVAKSLVPTEVEGGTILPDPEDPTHFTLIPKAKKMRLSHIQREDGSSAPVEQVTYRVVKPPKPEIRILVNGKRYDGNTPINKKSILTIEVVPDYDFATSLPRDAVYFVEGADVLVYGISGSARVASFRRETGEMDKGLRIPLGGIKDLKRRPTGTRIAVQITGIYRKNFQGKMIEERYSGHNCSINTFVLK